MLEQQTYRTLLQHIGNHEGYQVFGLKVFDHFSGCNIPEAATLALVQYMALCDRHGWQDCEYEIMNRETGLRNLGGVTKISRLADVVKKTTGFPRNVFTTETLEPFQAFVVIAPAPAPVAVGSIAAE